MNSKKKKKKARKGEKRLETNKTGVLPYFRPGNTVACFMTCC